MQNTQEKHDLQKTKVNATKIRKIRADRYKLHTAGHTPSSLDGRSVVVVRQADEKLTFIWVHNVKNQVLKLNSFIIVACYLCQTIARTTVKFWVQLPEITDFVIHVIDFSLREVRVLQKKHPETY